MTQIKKFFIKGWKKKYSINEKGEVWSHYRYNNQGKRFYRDMLLAPTFNTRISTTPVVNFTEGKNITTVFVRTLMKEYFKLTPPDKYHQYSLQPKDGNRRNSSLSNLEWRLHLNKDWLYYPQPFYDKKGNISEKICGTCGVKKNISDFILQDHPDHKAKNRQTYKNKCLPCTSARSWIRVQSNPELLAKLNMYRNNFSKSKEGRLYYRVYDQRRRDALNIAYVKATLCRGGILVADLTPQMIEIQAKSLALRRDYKSK